MHSALPAARNTPPSVLQRLRGTAPRISPFAREIALVLLIKVALLWLLWWACFSSPLARHMRLDPELVKQQLLSPPATEPPHAKP